MFEDFSTAPDGVDAPGVSAIALTVALSTVKALLRIGPLHFHRVVPVGLYVDEGTQGTILVASDGNVLVAYRACALPRPRRETILPYADLKELPSKGQLLMSYVNDRVRFEVKERGHTIVRDVVPIGGTYPDWRALLPERFDPQHREVAFDPALQAKVEDCIEAITGTKQTIITNDAPGAPAPHSAVPVRYLTTRSAELIGIVQGREEFERDRFGCPAWVRR